jgi:hypothetical protein
MKTLLLICSALLLFLISCKEGPQGPAGPPAEDPTDPNIAPRVVWVWLDSQRPYYWICDSYSKLSDSLPIGYIPGRLLIRFNKIMVSYTVIPNVTLLPKEDGYAYLSAWGATSIDGQTFELPIYGYFKLGHTYTVTVGKEATDVTNRKLGINFQKVLVPEPVLRIRTTYPENNDTSVYFISSIYATFNSPVDPNSLSNNITISPYVKGSWVSNYSNLENISFYPDSSFRGNTWYEITFSTGIKDTLNNHLPYPATFRFKTIPFRVTSTYPWDGQQYVNRSENITAFFSAYIDTSSVRNAVTISPPVNGMFDIYNTQFIFDPYQSLLPDTTYTVTIRSSMRSRAGDTLATPYLFSFKTLN